MQLNPPSLSQSHPGEGAMQLNSIYCHSTTNGVWVVSGKRSRCTTKTAKASPNQEGKRKKAKVLLTWARSQEFILLKCNGVCIWGFTCVLRLPNGPRKIMQTERIVAFIHPPPHFVLPGAKSKSQFDNTKLREQSLLIILDPTSRS